MTSDSANGSTVGQLRDNVLLAAWPGRLPDRLRLLDLEHGDVLQRAERRVSTAYFPLTAVAALTVPLGPDGDTVEIHHVGREGLTGGGVITGDARSPFHVSCLATGLAAALPAADLVAAADADGEVRRLLGRYEQAWAAHLARRVACTSAHTTGERLAAALLTTAWQTNHPDTVALTQTHLARMLLVRRATVSAAATRLADSGAIRYRYGRITIADPDALQRAACACHRANREAYLAVGGG